MKKGIVTFFIFLFLLSGSSVFALTITKNETRDIVGSYGAINPDSPYFPHTRIPHPDSGTSDGMIKTTDVEIYPGNGRGDFEEVKTVTIKMHDHDDTTVVAISVHRSDGTWTTPVASEYDISTIGGDNLCGEDSTIYGLNRHPHNDAVCYVANTFTINVSTDALLLKFSCAQISDACPRSDDVHVHISDIIWDIEDVPTLTPAPTLNPVPNCFGLNGPTTLRVGESGTYTATVSSAQGQLIGEISRDNQLTINQTRFNNSSQQTGTISGIWIPTLADVGTHTVWCRAWNDSIAECRPPQYVDRPPRYACAGPGYAIQVTVLPVNTPIPTRTLTPTRTPTATIVPPTTTMTPVVLKSCNNLSGCTTGAECVSGYCYTEPSGLSFCRNPNCPADNDCSCFGGPTPTPAIVPGMYCPL